MGETCPFALLPFCWTNCGAWIEGRADATPNLNENQLQQWRSDPTRRFAIPAMWTVSPGPTPLEAARTFRFEREEEAAQIQHETLRDSKAMLETMADGPAKDVMIQQLLRIEQRTRSQTR